MSRLWSGGCSSERLIFPPLDPVAACTGPSCIASFSEEPLERFILADELGVNGEKSRFGPGRRGRRRTPSLFVSSDVESGLEWFGSVWFFGVTASHRFAIAGWFAYIHDRCEELLKGT